MSYRLLDTFLALFQGTLRSGLSLPRAERAVKLVAVLAFGLLVGSCQDATDPSPTPTATPSPPKTNVLIIEPALDGVMLGSTETFAAVVVSGDGTRRTVAASWSSDAPEVAPVTDDGRVRGLRLGKATIRATFEALSALQLLRVVPDYQGTWTGDYRITDCTRLSGPGPNICKFVVGAVLPIRAVLIQYGAGVRGTLEFYTNTNNLFESGPVESSIDEVGALVLMGTTRAVDPTHSSYESTLSDWSTTLTGDGNQMAGRFVRNCSFRNGWGLQEVREECEIVKVEGSRAEE